MSGTGCLILGDAAVHKLLINLTKPDILTFQRKLQESLKGYSAAEREYQPDSGVSVRRNGQKTLFRPFTSPSSVGCKIIVDPAPEAGTGKKSPLHGVLVVCDNNGIPSGILNAEEITAFRTSLSALIPWTWRRHTEKVLVFGAGKQALWHIRLALALRGDEIKSVTFVNRTKERAQTLVDQLRKDNDSRWHSKAELDCIATSDGSDEVKKHLSEADAIFCTVPSQEALFQAWDVQRSAEQRKPYISAIGSWQPNMIELDPGLLTRVVSEEGAYNPLSKDSGGAILVDDRKSVSEHTGEILQSKLPAEQLIELGQILEIQDSAKGTEETAKLNAWLQDSFIVYKSVGVSLTDLASGEAILELAKKQENIGTLVTDL
ncbi:Putative ornithine cyclodeaminase/mu-crystallin, NAD(P)-binding domain superfamily [Septoria linicola]|uniref:Ornithine cyclodeaminase/mu-crystallin, NAD(P)-binding domain superfamily n=1 Tax=Septoria linicola TaxID=215465 RepID=A0A9Q9B486_9PEZI|nr:Putative ornithine cyclodeaminase/mu-crystallin, NAD(P)-binding domain superfamily [Septoria linicola]